MNQQTYELLYTLEGLQTVETVMKKAHLTRQSAINLLSKLKKQQHVTVSGKGKTKRLYKITIRKQLPRDPGMFDILNKHNPNFQINPWYDHQVHGKYGVEEAIIDAIQTKMFRPILATLRLFNHVKDWPSLYQQAKKEDCWQQVGALYDVARMFFKTRKMPDKYRKTKFKKIRYLIERYKTKEKKFQPIRRKWQVPIPFLDGDLRKLG
jgi:hypothetical protein